MRLAVSLRLATLPDVELWGKLQVPLRWVACRAWSWRGEGEAGRCCMSGVQLMRGVWHPVSACAAPACLVSW